MSSISPEDYIGEIFGFTLFAIILHFYAKSFLKDKLKTKEEFEKFVAENGSSPKKGFYYKKMDEFKDLRLNTETITWEILVSW